MNWLANEKKKLKKQIEKFENRSLMFRGLYNIWKGLLLAFPESIQGLQIDNKNSVSIIISKYHGQLSVRKSVKTHLSRHTQSRITILKNSNRFIKVDRLQLFS